MNDLWSDVRDFNLACGVRLRENPGWVSEDEVALAVRLVGEERDELLFALATRNLVEAADAIADSLYVRAGLLLRLGLARTYIHDFLPKSTEQATWDTFDATNIMTEIGDDLEESDARIGKAIADRNLLEVDAAVHQTMFQLTSVATLLHLPMDRVWAEVQRSNMAKLVDGKVVRRPEDGKILKPAGWTPPDIAGVLGLDAVEDAA
ncbi:pyrophosphohydrolase domain-containing protein [Nocardia rhizosphaerae]|uniref:Phosphoribosyl-ATP pyrophosphohydrolase n=1 Tax=Nocardia rhizosphaerae TaxID=1691571 RepID=A0ABV8LDG0_9NOCA